MFTQLVFASNVRRIAFSLRTYPIVAFALLTLVGCGGGGGGESPATPPPTPPPPETLFVASNAWNGTRPANAETITPDEFRRRQVAGDLEVVTPATPLTQRTTRERNVEAERAFLESKTDLSEDVLELLAELRAANDVQGQPVATLPNGQKVALVDLGSRIEKAAQDYRMARDPANARAAYALSYSLLPDDLKGQAAAPATLQNATLEQIRQADDQLSGVLSTLINLDNTRIDPDAPATPIGAISPRFDKNSPGNGIDVDGACTPAGFAKRYWFPLRSFVSPVRDQASRGTCWAFAAIGAVESRERVQNDTAPNLSEQFLVNKVKREWYPNDWIDGGSAASALNTAVDRNQALLSEGGWTYNRATGRPANAFDADVVGTSESYTGACNNYTGWCSPTAHQSPESCATVLGFDFCGYNKVAFNGPGIAASRVRLLWSRDATFNFRLDTYRAYLSSGVTLLASFPVYVGFQNAPGGIVSDYRKKQMVGGAVVDGSPGGHLVQIIGFISNEEMSFPGAAPSNVGGGGYFIIRNSWGCGVGDAGYYYVPADYVSTIFSTIEVLDFDARRSARWTSEQVTPGGTSGLAIDPKGSKLVDLRVQDNLASSFVVSHPVANYVRLTVTSNRDGTLFDGQWLVNAPIGGSLFANSLPVNFQTEGTSRLTITARYGSQVVTATKDILVYNSPPSIDFQSSGNPQQNENFVINALVTDRNDVNPIAICNAMIWQVTAPDTVVSGSGCTRVIRFGVTGAREVRVDSQDAEGRAGAAIGTFNVLPPPVNPYPRITTFGVYQRDFQRIGGQVVGCQNNAVANNAVIDLRQIGCKLLGFNVPDKSLHFAQLGIENPDAEVLSYDWTYTDYYPIAGLPPRVLNARTATPTYDLNGFLFGSAGSPGVSTHTCTIDVRVNAPQASRSKTLRVWSGRCVNQDDAVR
jgi:Papain family cysteine protease